MKLAMNIAKEHDKLQRYVKPITPLGIMLFGLYLIFDVWIFFDVEQKKKQKTKKTVLFHYSFCFHDFMTYWMNLILNPLWTKWTPPHYILEYSNFNIWYVRLCELDIPREKRLNYLQTVETLIRCCFL